MDERGSQPTMVDADDLDAACADPKVHALWARAASYGERLVSPLAGMHTQAPETLWRPVADALGAEMARRWFEAPNERLGGMCPAQLMRSRPDRVAEAARALIRSLGG